MKTIIKTITFAVILSVLQLSAQESYKPVFGEGVTRFYFYYSIIDATSYDLLEYVPVEGQVNLFKKTSSFGEPNCDYVRVSEDNSKLWGYYEYYVPESEVLLMDLNLNAGDIFEANDYEKYTVEKVYNENGRKIIEFNEYLGTTAPFRFIEGIGSSAFFCPYVRYAPELRAQSKDGVIEYEVPEWGEESTIIGGCQACWGWDCESGIKCYFYPVGISEPKNELLDAYLLPSVVETTAQLYLPEKYFDVIFNLTVSTIEGKTVMTKSVSGSPIVLDMRLYPAGVYLLRITGNNISGAIKFIKK